MCGAENSSISASLLSLVLLACQACQAEDDSAGGLAPRLSSIQEDVFTPRCNFPSCHGDSNAAGGLVLEEGASHGQLVGVSAANRSASDAGLVRVVAGDPESSFLVQKLRLPVQMGYGDVMPPGSDGLEDEVVAVIEEWIDRGAIDD